MRRWLIVAALVIPGCDDDSPKRKPTGSTDTKAWTIGPVIDGENYSKGLPTKSAGSFAISPTAEPHYVTQPISSLVGKTSIRMRYKVEGPEDAVIHGAKCAETSPSAVTLYIQRDNDDWQKNGWRWWHKTTRTKLSGPGEWTIEAPLDGTGWGSVQGMTAASSPANWNATLRDPHVIGFTFGNCEGSGHGALATVPVKFTVAEFSIL